MGMQSVVDGLERDEGLSFPQIVASCARSFEGHLEDERDVRETIEMLRNEDDSFLGERLLRMLPRWARERVKDEMRELARPEKVLGLLRP